MMDFCRGLVLSVGLALACSCSARAPAAEKAATNETNIGGTAGETPEPQRPPEATPDAGPDIPDPPVKEPEPNVGGSDPGPVFPPPTVTSTSPLQGPWGTEIRITGAALGNAKSSGVFLAFGDNGLVLPTASEVVKWTEEEIVFRIPFPQFGTISVNTSHGSAVAGEFPAPWSLSAAQPVPIGTAVLASLSRGAGQIAIALDTAPASIVEFDGVSWRASALPAEPVLLEDTVRLYSVNGVLKAFALSASAEVVDFAFEADHWVATQTGISATKKYALAGGNAGGVVWFAQGNDWSRARATSGAWGVDKGPVTDPAPGDPLRAAGATSDGSLYLARPRDTGNFLDDLQAPFIRQVAAPASTFNSEFKAGASVDDYLTALHLRDRGRGVLVEYCGSDRDPSGLSSTAHRCYSAALTSAGFKLLSSVKETEFHAYHAATAHKFVVGMCNPQSGSVLAEGEDQSITRFLTWPCTEFGGIEVDPAGDPVVAIRYDGGLAVLLAPPGREPTLNSEADAGAPPDAGARLGDAGRALSDAGTR